MTEQPYKFDPRYSISLRGFDRRGCTALLSEATQTSVKLTGYFSDAADFIVLMIYNADDLFGHPYVNQLLPAYDLSGLVLDFDLECIGTMNPISSKFQSIPWGSWSYALTNGTRGTFPMLCTFTGDVFATATITVTSSLSPVAFDRVMIIFGGTVFDYVLSGGETLTDVADNLVAQINGSVAPFSASNVGPVITLTALDFGTDGNTIAVETMYKSSTCALSPSGPVKFTGGTNPTTVHVKLDFDAVTAAGFDKTLVRQLWLSVYPELPVNPDTTVYEATLVEFTRRDFEYNITNISVSGTGVKELYVPDRNCVIIPSSNEQIKYTGNWTKQPGYFDNGFAKFASTIGDKLTINYSYPDVHDLYLGTFIRSDGALLAVKIDGVSSPGVSLYCDEPIFTKVLIAKGISGGSHKLELEIDPFGGPSFYFDYLQALVPSPLTDAPLIHNNVSMASDLDTDKTYKIPPVRVIRDYTQLGMYGEMDFYVGVFFHLTRRRRGGLFNGVSFEVIGPLDPGNSFGFNNDQFFIEIGSPVPTVIGVGVYPADTVDTVCQRFVNAVNSLFVGIRAEFLGSGTFTITLLTPINGFAFNAYLVPGTSSSAVFNWTGNLNRGNEGIWEIDDSLSSPLNKATVNYLKDFSSILVANGINCSFALSHEIVGTPDVDTNSGSWLQRFFNRKPVLTATSFGSWGSGVVKSVTP